LACRTGCYLHNTQQTQEKNIAALSGIRNRDHSNRRTSDLCLKQQGHWDWLFSEYILVCQKCVVHYTEFINTKIDYNELGDILQVILWNRDTCSEEQVAYERKRVSSTLCHHIFGSKQLCTRWFKYDRDDLCVNKSQFVPVIFEPPCIWKVSGSNFLCFLSRLLKSTFL
jgi:hypothetical protein